MNIIKTLCNNFSSRDGIKPDVIVIHISAGSLTSMTSWFRTAGSQASSHYGIGKEGTILQYVEEQNMAWTNGLRWINGVACDSKGRPVNPTSEIVKSRPRVNPNKYSVTIENEGIDLRLAPDIQRQTLYKLIVDIAKRNNIPLDRKHVLGHFEIDPLNRSFCPSPDHTIIDKIVETCKMMSATPEPMVTITVPQSKLEKVLAYIKTI